MKFDVDDKNRCRLVCVKFHLNRCRFAVAVAKCLGGSLFWDTVYTAHACNRAQCPLSVLHDTPAANSIRHAVVRRQLMSTMRCAARPRDASTD